MRGGMDAATPRRRTSQTHTWRAPGCFFFWFPSPLRLRLPDGRPSRAAFSCCIAPLNASLLLAPRVCLVGWQAAGMEDALEDGGGDDGDRAMARRDADRHAAAIATVRVLLWRFGKLPACADIALYPTLGAPLQHAYVEALEEGKSLSVQAGFDAGYAAGVRVGLATGRLRGLLRCVSRPRRRHRNARPRRAPTRSPPAPPLAATLQSSSAARRAKRERDCGGRTGPGARRRRAGARGKR